MFSRAKEAYRILTHREPNFGPDAVVVDGDSESVKPTKFSSKISKGIELTVFAIGLGYVAGKIEHIFPDVQTKTFLSTATLIGALGVIFGFLTRSLIADIEAKLRLRIHLSETLAPFFGHKLESTVRVLKGTTRGA
ncbi:MAG: hypothetical protein ABSD63_18965 [Candidatus Korobacteraceae bacterium]